MIPEFIQRVKQHAEKESSYTQRDFIEHFSDKQSLDGLKDFIRKNSHKTMEFFHSSDDWQALVPPAFQATIAEYGSVDPLPDGLVTPQSEDRDHAVKRWVWKTEPIEDYLEGEAFKETYTEGATSVVRWRKPGAKIVETMEAARDLPLDVVQTNLRLTLNEFRAKEWKHFSHELHKGTSDKFDTRSTDKNGTPLNIQGWRDLFSNAYDDENASAVDLATWADIKNARQQMLRRQRDAVRPNVLIVNASTEASLSEDERVVNAHILGGTDTFFRTGTLPNIYGLQVIVIPDGHFGYFENDITRQSDEFILSNDAFLLTTNNGPTILRHNREPLSTETWRIWDGQKQALNIWERYDFSMFRYTNIMRIIQSHTDLSGTTIALD